MKHENAAGKTLSRFGSNYSDYDFFECQIFKNKEITGSKPQIILEANLLKIARNQEIFSKTRE